MYEVRDAIILFIMNIFCLDDYYCHSIPSASVTDNEVPPAGGAKFSSSRFQ